MWDGPQLHALIDPCRHPSRAAIYGRMVLEASIRRRTGDRTAHLGYVAQSDSPADVVFDQLDREIAGWTSEVQLLEQRWTRAGGDISVAGMRARPDPDSYPTISAKSAEISLVASLLASPRQFEQIKHWLQPDDFTHPNSRAIYSSIAELTQRGQPVDHVTVMWAAMRHTGGDDQLPHDTAARLAQAGVPGYAVVCAKEVLTASVRNRTNLAASQLRSTAAQPQASPAEVIRSVGRQLDEVAHARARWCAATA